ncbi:MULTISPECIES: TetR/AcrR family transcriptional regulator [unclassified Gordonia (in: high G+C Gram-positive bacteria)]
MRNDERITVAMGESLRRNGYAGTPISQVIAASGMPNGSLYHHFPGGKRELAGVALRRMGAAYGELVGGLLAEGDDLPATIEAAFTAAADDIERSDWINMCPVGTVAGETADSEPALREVAAAIFGTWIDGATALFASRGLADAEARALAFAVISALEGAFVLARTLRSGEPLIAAGRAMGAAARERLDAHRR